MDVEKIDLKTALERQKAILKAEREALEAEIAAESAMTTAKPDDEDDDLLDETGIDIRAAFGPASAPEFEDDTAESVEPSESDDEPNADDDMPGEDRETVGFDDWDDGLEAIDTDEQDEPDAPVDVTAFDRQDEPAADLEAAEEPVRDLDLDLGAAGPETADAEESGETSEAAPSAPIRRAGRVKTRLLGFQAKSDTADVFAGKTATGSGPVRFPVGWLVVTQGAGVGHSFSLLSGVSKIGRGDDQAVQLDFGDTSISRDNHAAIAFDDELTQFFLGHGGKSNVVRLNGKPVLSTEELYDGDEIRIGETTLKFIALCGEEFTWAENSGDDNDHARSA